MNPLHQIVRAGHCRVTHQLFAMDALPLVQTEAGQRLTGWLLRYYRRYLRGAVDPDIRFRDFHNHLIHVQDGFWGGAPRVAHQWYDRLQRYLRQKRFSDAAHAAGVLSHYFTDPIQPLNTGYSQAEEVVHDPLLWSIQRDYQSIYRQWRSDDLRVIFQLADGPGWLGAAMLHGAKYSHQRYDTLVQSYRLDAAVNKASAGIDSQLRVVLAELFGLAITGWARVIERAASDVEAITRRPLPRASRVWPLISATACLPVSHWSQRIQARMEDRQIMELVDEFRREGKLEQHLPAAVDIKKRVIKVHRSERRYRLSRKRQTEQRKPEQMEVQAIPIAPFLSSRLEPIESLAIDADDLKRLRAAGIHTVDDLERGDAADIATRLQAYWVTADVIGCWQRQASLMRQVSGLTPTAARMLVGAGFHDAMQVAHADINSIHQQVVAFAATTQGRRYLLGKRVPTREEVVLWVQHIKSHRHGPPDGVTFKAA